MVATVRGVIDIVSYTTLPTLMTSTCVFGVAVVMLTWRHRTAARPAGRHRRKGATQRLLVAGTEVTAVVNGRIWRGIVKRPTTRTDWNSGVFPVRFPFGTRLMCTDDVTVLTDSSLVGAP